MSSNSTATVKCSLKAEIQFVHLPGAVIQHPGLLDVSMTRYCSNNLLYRTSATYSFSLPLTFPLPNLFSL